MNYRITNGRVLLAGGDIVSADLCLGDGRIVEHVDGEIIDARGCLVIPGIVDVHGDAFERQIMPRPGVSFPLDLALLDTDRQMVANGITTAFHGLTWSWEPGLRGRKAAHDFMTALESLRPRLAVDTRVHLRWETYNLAAVAEVEQWLLTGRVGMLAFNDHFPEIHAKRHDTNEMSKYAGRGGVSVDSIVALIDRVQAGEAAVPAAIERLARAARTGGVSLLSHDDATSEVRRWYNALGCSIAEFPLSIEAAEAARDLGNSTVFGAPNVVRGKSHTGKVVAADMVAAGLCSILASDYYYPSLLLAPFLLAHRGAASLPAAWQLVSANPARAAGLSDRGEIAPGQRADLIIVDDHNPVLPAVVATFVAGKPVFRTL